MRFKCLEKHGKKIESWEGTITKINKHQECHEIWIRSRSSIMVMVGTTSRGNFVCCPDFNAGCHLVNLKDRFWNTERLTTILGNVDGITVAEALYILADRVVF